MRITPLLIASITLLVTALSANDARAMEIFDTRTLRINYKEPDPGGNIEKFELYITSDKGKTWRMAESKDNNDRYYFEYKVDADGRYGFKVVSISDVAGLSSPIPVDGKDSPDMEVIVDTTPPVVDFRHDQPVLKIFVREAFTIKWTAFDKNFRDQPILIQYAYASAGDQMLESSWTNITDGWVTNTGMHTCYFKDNITRKKEIRIRIRACDLALHESEVWCKAILIPVKDDLEAVSHQGRTLRIDGPVRAGAAEFDVRWQVAGYSADMITKVRLYVRHDGTAGEWKPVESSLSSPITYKLKPGDPDGVYYFYLGVQPKDGTLGSFIPNRGARGMANVLVDRRKPCVEIKALTPVDDNGAVITPEKKNEYKGASRVRIVWEIDENIGLAPKDPVHVEVSFSGGGDNSYSMLVGFADLEFEEIKDLPKGEHRWKGSYTWKLPRLSGISDLVIKVVAYDKVGNRGEGTSEVFRVISFAADLENDKRAAMYYDRGCSHLARRDDRQKNLYKAKESFEESLRYAPGDHRTHLALADTLHGLGLVDEAIRHAEQAREAVDNYEANMTLSVLYLARKRLDDAGLRIERVILLDGKSPLSDIQTRRVCRMLFDLADRFEDEGDLDAAIQYVSKIRGLRLTKTTDYWYRAAGDRLAKLRELSAADQSPDDDERFE
jgi:hypothetical protein